MKVLVLEVPDDLVAKLIAAATKPGEARFEVFDDSPKTPQQILRDMSKPPTQGVVAGMGDTSHVQSPKSPPAGFLKMSSLANHPWFQEFVGVIELPERMKADADGDSLRLAKLFLGANILDETETWGSKQEWALSNIVEQFGAWCKMKGYVLDD